MNLKEVMFVLTLYDLKIIFYLFSVGKKGRSSFFDQLFIYSP